MDMFCMLKSMRESLRYPPAASSFFSLMLLTGIQHLGVFSTSGWATADNPDKKISYLHSPSKKSSNMLKQLLHHHVVLRFKIFSISCSTTPSRLVEGGFFRRRYRSRESKASAYGCRDLWCIKVSKLRSFGFILWTSQWMGLSACNLGRKCREETCSIKCYMRIYIYL